MKTTLPIRKCPCYQGKHSKVVAIGSMSDSYPEAPFQICGAHLQNYQNSNWLFRVVMLEEFLKYPCFQKKPEFWCTEQLGHSCIPEKIPETSTFDFEHPERQGKTRKGRGEII